MHFIRVNSRVFVDNNRVLVIHKKTPINANGSNGYLISLYKAIQPRVPWQIKGGISLPFLPRQMFRQRGHHFILLGFAEFGINRQREHLLRGFVRFRTMALGAAEIGETVLTV